MLFFGLLELCLRLAGFGYPTGFLLESANHGEKTFVQNNKFGWRFFGPRMARLPEATCITRDKPRGTIRIIVFGESAAYGDPQPRFGLPRMLEALLELRHPEKKFEVINAAMTGINSHVILPLARDCTAARGDVWVIYMGNNEVVGPFGAGTVFGKQTSPLPLIRAGLSLKATRVGQLLDIVRGKVQKTAAESSEWEGMRPFVRYKLAASDSRLRATYQNFQKNLEDIISAGRNSGTKIVLSTVAVNLKDCAPFASLHQPGLTESRLKDWQDYFQAGVKAQESDEFRQAEKEYDQAAQIDQTFAELRYRRGQCELALNEVPLAQKEFATARDLDALRFRCDHRLNEIIRQQSEDEVILADSERALAEASSDGIPGAAFFYEHVHLTFNGNYVLARAIAEKVETALALSQRAPWPEIAECAQRLGYTSRDTQLAISEILGRLGDVPFTFQVNHSEQMRRLTEAARQLPWVNSAQSLREARSATEAALARWPDDAVLWQQLSEIQQAQGNCVGAIAAIQHTLDKVPSNADCWFLDGLLLVQEAKYQDAMEAFREVLTLNPQAVWAGQNVALCLEKLGRTDEAVAQFKHALDLNPEYGTGWLALGQLYDEIGRSNEAERCYDRALTNRVNQPDDLAMLARFCLGHGRLSQAVTNFAAAIELSPSDPGLRMDAGLALSALGREDEGERQLMVAIQLAPDQAQPHLLLGVQLGRLGKHPQAEQEFRQALKLDSGSIEARMNLGIALYKQKKFEEALEEFEEVLQFNPKSATALGYVQLLRSQAPLRTAE